MCEQCESQSVTWPVPLTVPQHHSAPEDLLPPLTCPLPGEPCPRGPSVAPASTPARGQHPGGVRLRGV